MTLITQIGTSADDADVLLCVILRRNDYRVPGAMAIWMRLRNFTGAPLAIAG